MNAVVDKPEGTARVIRPAVPSSLVDNDTQYRRVHANPVSPHKHPLLAGTRITFINRYFYPDISATSQILFDLTRRLVKQGVIVNVVCSRQLYANPQAALPEYEEVEGVKVYRVRTTQFGRDWLPGRLLDYLSFYAAAVSRLLKITRANDVLVAKTDPPLISLAVAVVAKWRGAKLVNWLQDLFPEVAAHLGTRLPTWVDWSLIKLRNQSLHVASANVVIGGRMRDHLLTQHVHADKIHVVENWADSDVVEPKPANASVLRTSLGLRDKFVVGYSGNLGRAHEYETILNAAIALRLEPDVVFLMVGGGANMQRLQQAVAEHGLKNFIFKSYQPRELLADSMAAADVHLTSLLPQLEGLIVPSKFYGILAAGRPSIVVGDIDGELARAVKRERCGEVVETGDWESLVSAIWHLKIEPEYRRQLGARAHSVFLKRHTAEQGARLWMHTLEAVQRASK